MILTRAELIAKLGAVGIPLAPMQYLAPDEVGSDSFGTVSMDFIQRAYASFIDLLKSDPNAKLTMMREVGRSGLRVEVPRYVSPGFVCRHAGFSFFGFLILCAGKQACATPQTNDGYAFAPIYYTATPRPGNGNRDGRHCRIFFVNDAGEVDEFEEGDGDPEPMTPEEFASATFVVFV